MLSPHNVKEKQINFPMSPILKSSYISPSSTLNSNSNSNPSALVAYLNSQVKSLEMENAELKKEIMIKNSFKNGDNALIEYYIRLRKELFEEIEKLKNEKISIEQSYSVEIEKLLVEIASLTSQIDELMKGKNANVVKSTKTGEGIDILWNSDRGLSITGNPDSGGKANAIQVNSKSTMTSNNQSQNIKQGNYFKNLHQENENVVDGNFSDDNFFLSSNMMQMFLPSTVAGVEGFDPNINCKNSQSILTNNNMNQYIHVISDLEDRVRLQETVIKEKEAEIITLKEGISKSHTEVNMTIDEARKDADNWKQKFLFMLSGSKSLSQEFQILYDQSTANLKEENENKIYELEKKIIHIERINEKYEQDLETMSKMCSESENVKQAIISKLKAQMKYLIENYQQLYTTYEDSLKILTKQIDSMKQLYMTRENEFINITNYYTQTINDYSKPIDNTNQITAVLEGNYTKLAIESEDLRKKIEGYIQEINQLKSESVEYKPKMRQKIIDTLKIYDEHIQNIIYNHSNISTKLNIIANFMVSFEEKFTFFSSLLEDNKKLEEKINVLECQLRMEKREALTNENISLREAMFKLQKEMDIKTNMLREFEEIIMPGFTENNTNTNPSISKQRYKKEQLNEDITIKLKTQIAHLSCQVLNLTKTKESIEKFYQVELKSALETINHKTEQIEELNSIITKMENDLMGKKETIFNLWMLEFKEFKDNLITIEDIRLLVQKFHVAGEELNLHKDMIYNEELYIMRQEIKVKDEEFQTLKSNHEKEKKKLTDLIDNYKKTIDEKIVTYDKLNVQKSLEVAALINEKERLKEIDKKKSKLTSDELFLWEEQKRHVKKILSDHSESKSKEISFLKNQLEILQKELDSSRKINESNLQTLANSIEKQLTICKERELFTVSQLLQLEGRFKIYRIEKERMIGLLKEEISEIKGHNALLGKIK